MSCILCFTDDRFQERLRTLSQCRFERFEDTLEDYQNNLLSELENLSSVEQSCSHSHLTSKAKSLGDEILDKILDLPSKGFCNSVREIYITWISKSGSAIDALIKLLDEHQLLEHYADLRHHTFFRARKSNAPLTKEDLFHIPFNRRSIIKNQRYSIAGQPILYLALSPLSIVNELRQELSDLDNIYFCSYLHKGSTPLKVFDNTNKYPEKFSDAILFYLENDSDYPENPDRPSAMYFFKFLFAQFCSFKRPKNSDGHVFCEEYVLPQLLTEALHLREFDGIMFSSTRINEKQIISTAEYVVNRHRENIALFTSYNKQSNLDTELWNKFLISKPQCNSDLVDLTLVDVQQITNHIVSLQTHYNLTFPFPFNGGEIFGIKSRTRMEKLIIKNSNDQEVMYFDHNIGRMHIQLVYQNLLEFRNQMMPHT